MRFPLRIPSLHLLEFWMTPEESSLKIRLAWRKEPEDVVRRQESKLACGLVEPFSLLASTLWGTEARFTWSTPELLARPGVNFYEVVLESESHPMPVGGPWAAINCIVNVRDRYNGGTLAPHRVELYVTCYDTYDASGGGEPNATPEAADWIRGRLPVVATPLSDLLRLAYEPAVAGIDFSEPLWESDAVPWHGGDAFRITGVVLREIIDDASNLSN